MAFTTEQLVTRWEQLRAIKNLMGRMSADYVLKKEGEMFEKYWSSREDVSLGVNTGFYTGMDEIERYFVLEDAELPRDKTGYARMTTLTTPLIKIHGDGKTAQYQGYMPGFQSFGKADGTMDSYLTLDMCFADLIKEDGDWKIWHLILMHDHTMEAGQPYGKVPTFNWEDPLAVQYGQPTEACLLYTSPSPRD